ncbi:MAG: DNA-binding response regulator [Flavobacteriales bacterium]|nr:DNA-binding response regulator [Flavobacteriales bacterium]
MSRLKLVIIEDEFFAANHLADIVESLGHKVTGIYHSGETFIMKTDWDFDGAIVDILLADDLTGLDVGKELIKNRKPFVFLTANQDAATLKEAAHLMPVAYLSKPFKPNDVSVALEIISIKMVRNIQVKASHGLSEISPYDILFVKSAGSYVEIQTTKAKYVERKLLKEIILELPEFFQRVHRSYIVNQEHIEQISSSQLIVKGFVIPISRGFNDEQ